MFGRWPAFWARRRSTFKIRTRLTKLTYFSFAVFSVKIQSGPSVADAVTIELTSSNLFEELEVRRRHHNENTLSTPEGKSVPEDEQTLKLDFSTLSQSVNVNWDRIKNVLISNSAVSREGCFARLGIKSERLNWYENCNVRKGFDFWYCSIPSRDQNILKQVASSYLLVQL